MNATLLYVLDVYIYSLLKSLDVCNVVIKHWKYQIPRRKQKVNFRKEAIKLLY